MPFFDLTSHKHNFYSDNSTKMLVKDLLQKLKSDGTSIIGIFHDLEFMDGLCDQVYNITKGRFEKED